MARNLVVAGVFVAAVAVGILMFLKGGAEVLPEDPTNVTTTDDSTTGALANPLGAVADDVPEFDESSSEIDLASGPAALSGIVSTSFGAIEPAAQVTLYKLNLPEAIVNDGGIPVWRFFRGNYDLTEDLKGAASPLARVIAADDGAYAFNGLAAGNYLVAALSPGHLNSPVVLDYVETPMVQNLSLIHI